MSHEVASAYELSLCSSPFTSGTLLGASRCVAKTRLVFVVFVVVVVIIVVVLVVVIHAKATSMKLLEIVFRNVR